MSGKLTFTPVAEEEVSQSIEASRRRLFVQLANAAGQFNLNSIVNYLAALSNFETTVSGASLGEGRADMLGSIASVALKAGFKEVTKATLGASAPLAETLLAVSTSIKQELERAKVAQVANSVAKWIRAIRTGATDAYTKCGTSQVLLRSLSATYEAASAEDDRQALVDDASYALAAFEEGTWSVQGAAVFEKSLYEAWINEHFTYIGRVDDDVQGFLDIRFEDDLGAPSAASVVAPLGDRIADALNGVAPASGIESMMALAVRKRVCRYIATPTGGEGWSCGWFDDRNELLDEPISQEVTDFLSGDGWRATVSQFTSS